MQHKILVAILAGVYPAIFFLSNNWHIFSLRQSITLLIGTALVSLILLMALSAAGDLVARFMRKKNIFFKDSPAKIHSFFNPILSLLTILFCVYLLRNTLESIDIHQMILYGIIGVLAIVLTRITHQKGLKPILYGLVLLSSLSIINLFINVHQQTSVPIEDWTIRHKAACDQIKFRKNPNVYMILMESYANKYALEAVYNLDNSPFYKAISELGFKINHHHFSNYNHTLASLSSIFGMDHHYGLFEGRHFDSLGGRRLLEAKVYNPVIDVFRANHYKIQYLHSATGLMPNGANVDFCMPAPSMLNGLEVFLTQQDVTAPSVFDHKKTTTSLASIKQRIAETSSQNASYFSFIYLNFPGHSPSRLRDRSKKVINQKLGQYRNSYGPTMEAANRRIIDLLQHIIDNDREAIILLIGDHGSWGFRFGQDTEGKRVPFQLFILDRFGVFAGIRAPDALSDLMENGTIKSHVNLFKYIFAHLSEDKHILKSIAPDDSYDGRFRMAIKDGKILDDFVKIKLTKNHQL